MPLSLTTHVFYQYRFVFIFIAMNINHLLLPTGVTHNILLFYT